MKEERIRRGVRVEREKIKRKRTRKEGIIRKGVGVEREKIKRRGQRKKEE